MLNENIFDKNDDYIMITAYGISGLKNLGITKAVSDSLKLKGFVDFESNQFKIPTDLTIQDINLLIDFYIGTILNNFTVELLKENVVEIELPTQYDKFSTVFNQYKLLLKWNNLFFSVQYTEYNQFVICYLGEAYLNDDKTLCFNLSPKV